MNHPNSTFNHVAENWSYPDAATRVADATTIAQDIGKIAFQSDNGSYWRLATSGATPVWQQVAEPVDNVSTSSQSPAAATRTYITGSQIKLGKLKVGSRFRWKFNLTKTAAGVASSTIDVALGTAGTTADTARLSFTKPAGAATADEGWVEIEVIVRAISATGVIVGEFVMSAANTTGGHFTSGKQVHVVNVVSAAFDTTAPTFIGVCITTGASDVITIQQVTTESYGQG
jgi:hypothetical protein